MTAGSTHLTVEEGMRARMQDSLDRWRKAADLVTQMSAGEEMALVLETILAEDKDAFAKHLRHMRDRQEWADRYQGPTE